MENSEKNIKNIIIGIIAIIWALSIPNIYKNYHYLLPESWGGNLDMESIVSYFREMDPEFFKDWSDDDIYRSTLSEIPEIKQYLKYQARGISIYEAFGPSSVSSEMIFSFQLEKQWMEIKIFFESLMPWNDPELMKEKRLFYTAFDREIIKNNSDYQTYLAWKKDESNWSNIDTVKRSLIESLPSLIIIGVPYFLLSLLHFSINSKKELVTIIKKYGYSNGKWVGFGISIRGILSYFTAFIFSVFTILKSFIIASFRVLGFKKISQQELIPEKISLINKAIAIIYNLIILESLILIITFVYISSQ